VLAVTDRRRRRRRRRRPPGASAPTNLRTRVALRSVGVVTFQGWAPAALAFYEGLEGDNTKRYWTEHRSTYDHDVLAPMRELLAELAPRFGEGKVFRPFRDVRFSADKSPYKTAIGATTDHGGYVQLSAKGLAAGAGYYQLANDQLSRFRDTVDDEATGQALVGIVARLAKKQIEIMSIDALKSAPRGVSVEHPRIELLRLKGLAAWRQWPIEPWLGTAGAKKRVIEFFEATTPLIDWLDDHVGPSNAPRR